jgi:hypothetical protein
MSVDPDDDPQGIFLVHASAQQWAKYVGGCACGRDACHAGVPCRNDDDRTMCRFCPSAVGHRLAATRLDEALRRRAARDHTPPEGQEALL